MRSWNAGKAIRPKPKSKAAAKRGVAFNKAILDHARSLGGKDIEDGPFPAIRLLTIFGPLRITPFENWLACRFEDEEGIANAAAFFNAGYQEVNPYSGKFNCHPPDGDLAAMVERCKAHIDRVPRPT